MKIQKKSSVFNQGEDSLDIRGLDSLDLNRKELGKPEYDEPTPEEEEMLRRRVADGDPKARLELWNRSLRYVMAIAQEKAGGNHESIKDLYEELAMASYCASQKWKPKGHFLGYAKEYILRAAREWLSKNNNELSKPNGIDPDEIEDPGSNTEDETEAPRGIPEIFTLSDTLFFELDFYTPHIRKGFLIRFYSELISHTADYFLGWEWFFLRYAGVKVKTCNYGKRHLFWFIPFLKKEFGKKEVKRWTKSDILKKFNNTINYIWHRYLEKDILESEFILHVTKFLLGHIPRDLMEKEMQIGKEILLGGAPLPLIKEVIDMYPRDDFDDYPYYLIKNEIRKSSRRKKNQRDLRKEVELIRSEIRMLHRVNSPKLEQLFLRNVVDKDFVKENMKRRNDLEYFFVNMEKMNQTFYFNLISKCRRVVSIMVHDKPVGTNQIEQDIIMIPSPYLFDDWPFDTELL